ncbi:conserved hypothetical protein [Rubrivivax sp. A210]|uniref:hypothetical protein n=1 Tax=Rubrivivax sp. A210 TaxID=2772301 RepID=UPI001918C731|nr:hypothetical protein [Rubrivivax sp. A210]CAD5374773.1 conserved hypothetical protein [Rubrivivax sp. A210]
MALSAPASERFEREYGCTVADWLRWMPEATAGHVRTHTGAATLDVLIGAGCLHLAWQVLPERVIALARLPRLQVAFHFDGVAAPVRSEFMRRFDLHLQRGGG